MATLTGTTIQSTYDSLLKVTDNDSITGSLKRITDGLGNNTPLYLSSSAVEIVSALNVIGNITGTNLSGTNTGDETKASIESKLGAATSSNSGYLTSTDWSTFNNKIAGSGTLNKLAKFSSSSSIADSTITDTGSAVTIGVATTVSGNLTASALIKSGGTASQILAADGSVITAGTNITISGGTISSSGGISGSGTTNTIPKFTGSTAIGNSNITDTGSLITLGSNSYINGQLGIGTSSLGVTSLTISLPLQNSATIYGVLNNGVAQSTATNAVNYFGTVSNTAAGSYTIPILRHYIANGGTFGAGSVVSTQVGYDVNSTLNGATTNLGFRGRLNAATGVWNLYMDGTADNYIAGSLGIGSTSLTGYTLRVAKNITGSTASYGMLNSGVVQSDVTSSAFYYRSLFRTAAAAFTLTNAYHFYASQDTLGAGSAVTTQSGFEVSSNVIGATNNYGFKGSIPAGANRWNLYMDGTANNYMAGALGIGTTTLTGYNINIARNLTGAVTSRGIQQAYTVQSDVTNAAIIYSSAVSTQATAFTLPQLTHYFAGQGTIGAGSTVTDQHGFRVESSLIGATNNYGFRGQIPAGTNRWNLYMDGTANNYLAGNLSIGTTTAATRLDISGSHVASIGLLRLNSASGNISAQTYYINSVYKAAIFADTTNHFNIWGREADTIFSTGTTITERMRITSAGNVGIGTTSPSEKLTVAGNIRTNNGYIQIRNTSNPSLYINNEVIQWQAFVNSSNNFIFSDAISNVLTLSYNTGNVGIGTTSPSQKLDVAGNINVLSTGAAIVGSTESIFFAGTGSGNYLGFGTNNAERMRLNTSGTLLVNTTTDLFNNAKLQVNGGMTYLNLFNRRTASYTLSASDQSYIVEMNVGSANNLTVPPNSSVAFPIGTEIAVLQYGAGQTTIVAGSGVTLKSKSNALKISGQYAGCTLVKVGTDEWYVIGDLTL